MIIDSHCHLDLVSKTQDLSQILVRASQAGVGLMQTICTKVSEFEEIKKIAHNNKEVFCSVGLHPEHVEEEGIIDVENLVHLTEDKKVIGLGETGLDYYRGSNTKDLQRKSFLNHIEVSQITGLPVIIHLRDAEEDMIEILRSQMSRKPFKAVLHCFTGSKPFADAALELGLYISASGIVTFKNAKPLHAIFKDLPLDRLLVETDAPYLAPDPLRGSPNEPAFVKHTVAYLAKLLERAFDEVANATTQNFFSLFNKSSLL